MVESARASYEKIQRLLQEENEFEDQNEFRGKQLFNDEVGASSTALTLLPFSQPQSNLPSKDTEIVIFHDKLQSFVGKFGLMQAPNLVEFSDLATEYSVETDKLRIQAKESKQLATTSNRANNVEQERRTERDFWSLLQVMSISDVMGVLENDRNQQALDNALAELSPVVTIPDYLNVAFAEDLRFKKAKVIKDWLENAYRDQVIDIAAPRSPPMFETWLSIQQNLQHQGKNMDIVRGKSQLSYIDPDSQLHPAGLLALVGNDQQDQEAMLFCIWQLIRSGQIDIAQHKAYEHQAFWLASSLRGCDPHWYTVRDKEEKVDKGLNQMDDEDIDGSASQTLMRRGNVRHGLSMKNAYQYASHLLQSQQKSTREVTIASQATMLEMSIYAAISNHIDALKSSELLTTWSDRLWIYVNGVYHRDLIRIYEQYYRRKSEHSRLYPGCDEQTIAINQWLSREYSRIVQGQIDEQIATAVPPPPTKNLECILRQLQIAFLGGVRSIKRYFESNLLELIEPKETYPGYEHVLRILVHVLLWCGLTPTTLSAPMDQVVNQELYYHTLEIYIAHLIEHGHYELVALYARFLSPHRRVVAYARLLLAIQSDHVHARASHVGMVPLTRQERDMVSRKALALAQQYFPDDLPDITRTVMEDSSKPTSLLASLRPEAPVSTTNANTTSAVATATKSAFLSPIQSGLLTGATVPPTSVLKDSGLMLVATSTNAKSVAGSLPTGTVIPSEADRLKLESLRWVVLESSQQEQQDLTKIVEVLRAVHRVIGTLLVDSNMEKIGLLPLVMDNYATEEIIARIDQHIDHLRVQHQYETPSRMVPIYEEQWKLDKDIYSLWHALRLIYQQREEWLECLRMIRLEQQRCIGQIDAQGRLVAAIPPMPLYHHLRNIVLDQILPLIETIFVANTATDSGGIVTVLQDSMNSAESVTIALLDDILGILQGRISVSDTDTNVALTLRDQSLLSAQRARDDQHLGSQITHLFDEIQQQLLSSSSTAETTDTSFSPQQQAIQKYVVDIQQFLPSSSSSSLKESISSEALLRVYKLLQVVLLRLKDVADTQRLLSLLVYYLLQMYVSCCLQSNEALTLYEGLQDTGVAETRQEILIRAFKLSDMMANEAPTLGLYRFLNTEQLETILQDIGTAAFYLLPNGPGSLSVTSPLLA